jgi:hypothetical protein
MVGQIQIRGTGRAEVIAARFTIIALILVLLLGASGHSQTNSADNPRDPKIIVKLGYVVTAAAMITPTKDRVDAVMNDTRGGNNSGIPLGCYILCPQKREFTSAYIHERASTVVNWTYDLHKFVSNADRPYDLDYMPAYKLVRSFASAWWTSNSPTFAHLPQMRQSAWTYEAILDGVQIWYRYMELDGTLSTDGIGYFDVMLATYEKASPSDIFF